MRLQLHPYGYSPAALDMLVTANAHAKSAQVAVKLLKKLAGITICESHLMELTAMIGDEFGQARDQQVEAYLAGELPVQVAETPRTVAVGVDGGRIFTRAENSPRGVHQPAWKETKVAHLTTLETQRFEEDPHPELPTCFVDEEGVGKMVREIKSLRNAAPSEAEETEEEERIQPVEVEKAVDLPEKTAPVAATVEDQSSHWPPQRMVRTCVTSMSKSHLFGAMVAAEAQRRGFFAAAEAAFLGDGLKWNWTLQKTYFPGFVPILDFIHPTTYLYEASRVVAPDAAWALCRRWMEATWQGRVAEVLAELKAWQTQHPSPPHTTLPDQDARSIVATAVTYLSNNQSRMHYPAYRRSGLPVTSAWVESLIKEINYRVKGSEKSWKRPSGCEAILQVRGAALCDDADRLSEHIRTRSGSPYHRRSTKPSENASAINDSTAA